MRVTRPSYGGANLILLLAHRVSNFVKRVGYLPFSLPRTFAVIDRQKDLPFVWELWHYEFNQYILMNHDSEALHKQGSFLCRHFDFGESKPCCQLRELFCTHAHRLHDSLRLGWSQALLVFRFTQRQLLIGASTKNVACFLYLLYSKQWPREICSHSATRRLLRYSGIWETIFVFRFSTLTGYQLLI